MKKGFTLIELMIVVAIISILSSIITIKLGNSIKKSKDSRVLNTLGTLKSLSSAYPMEHEGSNSLTIFDLKFGATRSIELIIENGIGTGTVTSYQVKAGTANKLDGTESLGRGSFAGEKNVVEIYYDNSTENLWIDGTTGSGIDFLDTKGNKWNEY
jgi:prepilin-type N-terminal cleavage/methylation domain-containing protein